MRHQLLGNRYRILDLIGEGGMAYVYVALDEKLGRRVAVKVLHEHMEKNADIRQRFQQEAQAVSAIEHPNIVKVYDYSGDSAGRLWIVTEVINGKNLAQYAGQVTGGALHPVLASCIVREICKALDKAHSHGIVHRDIKPENIMITTDGRVKLMDFGIAKDLGKNSMTVTGTFMGSPSYMSPEQIRGKDIDLRSDLYSLSVLFYEIVTGRLPFNGLTTHDVVLKIIDGVYTHPVYLSHALPDTLNEIIIKGMTKKPVHRFQTAPEYGAELDRFLKSIGFDESHVELERCFKDRVAYQERLNRTVLQAANARSKLQETKPQLPAPEKPKELAAPANVLARDISKAMSKSLSDSLAKKSHAKSKSESPAAPKMPSLPPPPPAQAPLRSQAPKLKAKSSSTRAEAAAPEVVPVHSSEVQKTQIIQGSASPVARHSLVQDQGVGRTSAASHGSAAPAATTQRPAEHAQGQGHAQGQKERAAGASPATIRRAEKRQAPVNTVLSVLLVGGFVAALALGFALVVVHLISPKNDVVILHQAKQNKKPHTKKPKGVNTGIRGEESPVSSALGRTDSAAPALALLPKQLDPRTGPSSPLPSPPSGKQVATQSPAQGNASAAASNKQKIGASALLTSAESAEDESSNISTPAASSDKRTATEHRSQVGVGGAAAVLTIHLSAFPAQLSIRNLSTNTTEVFTVKSATKALPLAAGRYHIHVERGAESKDKDLSVDGSEGQLTFSADFKEAN